MKKFSLIVLFILGQLVTTLTIGLLFSDFYPYFETWKDQMTFQEYITYAHAIYYPIYIILLIVSIVITAKISTTIHKIGATTHLYWILGILVFGWISIIIFSQEFIISTASLIASLLCTFIIFYSRKFSIQKEIKLK